MLRDPSESSVAVNASDTPAPQFAVCEVPPQTGSSAESNGRSPDVDELVSNFLAELNAISGLRGETSTESPLKGDASGTSLVAEVNEAAVPPSARPYDLELAEALDQLESREKITPTAPGTDAPSVPAMKLAPGLRTHSKRLRIFAGTAALVFVAAAIIAYVVRAGKPDQIRPAVTEPAQVPAGRQVKQNPPAVEAPAPIAIQNQRTAEPERAAPRTVAEPAQVARSRARPELRAPAADGRPVARPPAQNAAAGAASSAVSRPAVRGAADRAPAQKGASPPPGATGSTRPSTAPVPSSPPASAVPAPSPAASGSVAPGVPLVPPPAEKKPTDAVDGGLAAMPVASGSPATEPPKISAPPVYKPPTPAVATRKVLPTYPEVAARMRISGTVDVDADVDETGKVVRAVAISGPALLRSAAVEAVQKWQFKPATNNGANIPSMVKISVVFSPGQPPELE